MPKSPEQLSLSAVRPQAAKRDYKPFVPGPNPELPEFIKEHSTPYDPATDIYDVPAFDRDLVVDKAFPPKAIYDMHTYWSKKHWAAIREYIRHYLPEKYYPRGTGLVLDCFSGSGMTGVAAMMEDRPCVLIDASSAAAFISHCYTHPVDPEELREAYDRMMTEEYPDELKKKLRKITGEEIHGLQQELDWLYATKCDRCNGPATTEYVVYSERFQCPGCGEIVALYDCSEFEQPKKGRYCPHCVAHHQGQPHRDYLISTRSRRFGAIPVLVSYKCLGSCKPGRDRRAHNEDQRSRKGRLFVECDLAKIAQTEKAEIPHWYPKRKMMDVEDDSKPWGVKWRAGTANFRTVGELYVKRNLWALAAFRAAVHRSPKREPLLLVVTASCMWLSRMNRHRPNSTFKAGIVNGTYYIPQVIQAQSVAGSLPGKFQTILRSQAALCNSVGRSAGSAIPTADIWHRTDVLPPASVDYVFTDPPYLNLEVQYGELNFVWDSWLGLAPSDFLREEITLNPVRGITWDIAETRFRASIFSIARALKPGRYLSICYHDVSETNWKMVQNALLDAGFEIHSVTSLDPQQKTFKMLTMEKVVKSDLVLNCRRCRPDENRQNGQLAEAELVSNRVRDIVVETLSRTGGQTRDKLWDIVLKRLLARGQMAEHRFDDILAKVASRSESGRWFLKEEFEGLSQNDIRNEEEAGAALERFARLRSMGAPAQFAARIALETPQLAAEDEAHVEKHIRRAMIEDEEAARKFGLSGRLRGVEFYDCLFFYLTRFLKGRPTGKTPRRNLAEFLEEYLVRFKDGDKWLYRPPDRAQAESLRKSRQTGLGRRIRQYAAFLRGEGDFPKEKQPDARTLVAWLKHCSAFGLADEGVLLWEKGGLASQLHGLAEDERYDADEYYRSCKRKAARAAAEEEEDDSEDTHTADETEE